ncbi:MAG: LLM class flavin-dependent oxidoreductase [Gammaproteobacteria bacterium]|nr:LLM class flavin-dependent oxidoreductase [Gammaproteobacteria bacterium]
MRRFGPQFGKQGESMAEKRVAVTLPGGPKVSDTIARAQWAEAEGYSDAWFGDGGAPDALTLAAILGDHTERLRIGIAVTPVYTRAPSVLAATAYTVAQQLPGRFVMGLGSSSKTMMTGWNGIPLEKPLTRVSETVRLVKSMLAGEKSDFDGETLQSHGYRQPPLESPPPVYMAALVNRFMVCVTDDKDRARNAFRAAFAPYYATPQYNAFLAWAGYEEAAAAIREGWAAKDREKTSAALTDQLVDEIGVIGSAGECQERIRWAMETGVDTAIIAPLALDAASAEATLKAFTASAFKR